MSLREALSSVQAHNPECRQSERSESSILSISFPARKYTTRSKGNIFEKRLVLFEKVVHYANNFEVIVTQLQPQKQKEEKTDDVCSECLEPWIHSL